jgi:hypothetical protein
LIEDRITDQLDAGKLAHGGHVDQGPLHLNEKLLPFCVLLSGSQLLIREA